MINLTEGGIPVYREVNIQSLNDVADIERGLQVCKDELKVMMSTAEEDQKSIYHQLIREMKTNSASFVSGAAGTGKSYILRMLERYYKVKGYKVKKKINYVPLKNW